MAVDPYAAGASPFPAAPPAGEEGPPPGLLDSLLGGGGGEAPPDEMMMGGEEEEPIDDEALIEGGEGEEGGDPVAILRGLVADAQHYLDVEMDDEDKAEAAKVIAILQKLLARNQKQADAATGTTDTHRFMRRQVA